MANIKLNISHTMLFVLALTISKILTFEIVELENVGHGHSQWCHLMANIEIYKSRMMVLSASSHHF